MDIPMLAETILYNAKVATNEVPSFVEAVAITDGKITAVGTNDEVMRFG
jgi:predicted amidohydrolase YtcJ